jgi:glycosyltransferase involved in cell wall biosynthesis
MTTTRWVILAPVVPVDHSPHAGGRYLQALVRTVARHGEVTVVVPNTPVNRDSLGRDGVPRDLLIADQHRPPRLLDRMLRRVVAVSDGLLRRVDQGLPSLSLAVALLRRTEVRHAVARASVVDLQWSESIRLVRLVRHVNPQARVVGTFHDVQSQLFMREPADTRPTKLFRRLAAWQSRWHERRTAAALDEVAVFSVKDALLLGDPPHARVIHPPLATGRERFPEPPSGPPTVLFVAYFARAVNDDAARWLLHDVWPAVTAAVPDARLRLVGMGMSDALREMVDILPEVVATGFVEDVDREYDASSLVVVPLRQGAGVKFKTVEALLHGVPVVSTSVGAEGIGGPDLFAGLTDDPGALAAAVVAALRDPAPPRERARAAQEWAAREYSLAAFEENVTRHYGIA